MVNIVSIYVEDVRFPTSKDLTGSDAIHTDPDYSATYVTINTSEPKLKGFGIAFTIGKGNDIVAECIRNYIPIFDGLSIQEVEKILVTYGLIVLIIVNYVGLALKKALCIWL